ncbi:MAG: hypothetical protein NWR12_07640, partial [Haliea sp.]|nr:hypothetical protein [Haliea sp.]
MPLPPSPLLPWALQALSLNVSDQAVLQPLAGDASQRRYFRLQVPAHSSSEHSAVGHSSPGLSNPELSPPELSHPAGSWIVVDSPPATQKNK